MARKIEVVIAGDESSLRRSVDQSNRILSGFGSHAASIGKIAAGVFGGQLLARGAHALTSNFKSFIVEARESVKVGKLTDAVIKSTGGHAGVTAKQVGALADAISRKTGIDDEEIQASENLLLTFTNVRNEVGKGNDIFNQATQAVTDMSAALGQDAKSSSIQLGKALNDPIKGVTALQRVGVSFTEQQKDQIKTLVKSGKTLEAQKIILAEVQKEFGGAAEAAADPMQKLDVTIKNLKERIGLALLPILNQAADFLAQNLPHALDVATVYTVSFINTSKAKFKELQPKLAELRDKWREIETVLKRNQGTIVAVAGAVGTFVAALVALHKANSAMMTAQAAIQALGPAVGALVAAVGGPIALIIAAVLALAVGFYLAYTKIEPFRRAVDNVKDAVVDFGQNVFTWVTGTALPALQHFGSTAASILTSVGDFFRGLWSGITTALGPLASWINDNVISTIVAFGQLVGAWVAFIVQSLQTMATIWSAIFHTLWPIAAPILTLIGKTIQTFVSVALAVFRAFASILRPIWNELFAGIKMIVMIAFGAIRTFIEVVLGVIRGIFQVFTGLLHGNWSEAWNGLKTIVVSILNGVKDFVSRSVSRFVQYFADLPQRLLDAVTGLYDVGRRIVQAIIDGIKSMGGAVGDAIKGVLSHVPGASILSHAPVIGGLFSGDIGGWIPGGAGKPLLMVGHGGEYIMSRAELRGRPRADSPLQTPAGFLGRAVRGPRSTAVAPQVASVALHAPITIAGSQLSGAELERAVERAVSSSADVLVRALVRWQRGNVKLTSYLDRAA